MNKIYIALLGAVLLLSSCNRKAAEQIAYVGTFITETGTLFELKADSTATISFKDSLTYDARWQPETAADSFKYANIEFGGYSTYYYLHNFKLYRSSREMRQDFCGEKIEYIK